MPLLDIINEYLNLWFRRIRHFFLPELVYSPQGWVTKSAGWYDESVAKTQRARWPSIVRRLQGTGPLRTAFSSAPPEATENSLKAHDVIMTYAYALARAARKKDALSILDWGGGVGLYHLLANILFPDITIEYYSYDTPGLCAVGRELWPNDVFYDDARAALGRRYDLVVSSGALHYSQRWQETLQQLARAAMGYLFISRLLVVRGGSSFVFIQKYSRTKVYGYNMEVPGWVMNRDELLACARRAGMTLVREFMDPNRVYIRNIPAGKVEERGFLFARRDYEV